MSGKYSGVQAHINFCQYAEFVPCSEHSLNLVGVNAEESCNEVASFFSFFYKICIPFYFFVFSTKVADFKREY